MTMEISKKISPCEDKKSGVRRRSSRHLAPHGGLSQAFLAALDAVGRMKAKAKERH